MATTGVTRVNHVVVVLPAGAVRSNDLEDRHSLPRHEQVVLARITAFFHYSTLAENNHLLRSLHQLFSQIAEQLLEDTTPYQNLLEHCITSKLLAAHINPPPRAVQTANHLPTKLDIDRRAPLGSEL